MRETLSKVPKWLWAAIAAPRLALLALAAAEPSRCLRADSQGYLAEAGNLLRHFSFSSDPTHWFLPETFRTPGYPAFLVPFVGLFEGPALAIAAAQCVLGGAAALLAWRWGERIGGKKGAAVCGLVLALDPVLLFHTPLVMTEILFLAIYVAALYETWEARETTDPLRAGVCGLLWGWSAMVRPISLYLPPFIAWWFWRKDKRMAAVFLAAAWALPLAWTARNVRRAGAVVFSSQGGRDLLRYPGAGVEALRTGRPWAELDAELRAQVDAAHPQGYATDAEQGAAYGAKAMELLKPHPFLLMRYCAVGAAKVLGGTGLEMLLEWTGGGRPSAKDQEFRPRVSGQGTLALLRAHQWLVPLQLGYMAALGALYLGFAAGLWALWTRGLKPEAGLLLILFGYFLGLSSTQGYYRYRIPLLPVLAAGTAANFRTKKS